MIKIKENIRGTDVFIVQPTQPPAENMLELLLMLDAVRRAFQGGKSAPRKRRRLAAETASLPRVSGTVFLLPTLASRRLYI